MRRMAAALTHHPGRMRAACEHDGRHLQGVTMRSSRSSRARLAAFAAGLVLAAGSALAAAPAADAQPGTSKPPTAPPSSCNLLGVFFHCYAIGWDKTHGPYDGIGVTRSDINIGGITAGSSCTSPPTVPGW